MNKYLAAAAVAMVGTGAQAAVVDLTYTVEAQITSVFGTNNGTQEFEFTREVGDIEFYTFEVAYVEGDASHYIYGLGGEGFGGNGSTSNVDLQDGSGGFSYSNADESYSFLLLPDGTGSLNATIASAPEIDSFLIWETAKYDVLSYSVDGLPAPVPLPASLPFLLAGIGAVGIAARCRNARVTKDTGTVL